MNRTLIVLLVALLLTSPGLPQARARPAQSRLFAPENLGLLEGRDREAWQKPDLIMDALGIADGSIVADVGSGGGWFTVRLARRVGPNGTVYAEDIQPQMIEATERRVLREGLRNVQTVLGTSHDPRLPESSLDAVLIVDTFHEMDNAVALLRNLARSLKPQGRIGIVDYKKQGGGPGPPRGDRVDPATVVQSARAAGLKLHRQETFLPYQFFVIVGK